MSQCNNTIDERLAAVETELQKHEKAFMQHQVAVSGLTQFLQVVSQAGDLEDVKEAAIDVLAVLNDVEE